MNEVDLGSTALCLLIGAGALSGVASFWAFRRWSDSARVRLAINHIVAHLLELRLFAEEPGLVLRAQRDLLTANGQLLLALAGPSLIIAIPFTLLLIGIDAVFGRAPLRIGSPAIVTVQWHDPHQSALPEAQLVVPAEMRVETPPVHVPAMLQTSWRVRPLRAYVGQLQIRLDNQLIQKSISSGQGLQWLSDRRAGRAAAFALHPFEPPFSNEAVSFISVHYPPATLFGLNWLVWFSAASVGGGLTAALVSNRF